MGKYFKIIRSGNGIIAGSGVLLGALYMSRSQNISLIHLILGFCSLFCLAAAGNIHNDLLDLKTDKISHPNRPLPAGLISKSQAFFYSLLLYIVGFSTSLVIGQAQGLLALIIIILLIAYNHSLKHISLIGNLTIAILCGIPFYYFEFPKMIQVTLLPFLFAFLTTLIRELIKDIEDMKGDKVDHRKTFPIKYGLSPSRKLLALFFGLLFLLFPLPSYLNYHSSFLWISLLAILPSLLFCFKSIAQKEPQWGLAQKSMKIVMIAGFFALASGFYFSQ